MAPWERQELRALVGAWRAEAAALGRAELLPQEKPQLHARYLSESGARAGRSASAVVFQLDRVTQAFRFVEAFGASKWFALPWAAREELRRANESGRGMVSLERDLYDEIAAFVRPGGASSAPGRDEEEEEDDKAAGSGDGGRRESGSDTEEIEEEDGEDHRERSAGDEVEVLKDSTPSAAAVIAAAKAGNTVVDTPASSKTRRSKASYGGVSLREPKMLDQRIIIRAWNDVLRGSVEANEASASLDPLILKRYVELGGGRSVDSPADIMIVRGRLRAAFDSITDYLKSRPHDEPKWFAMSASERLAQLQEKGHGKHDFVGTITSDDYSLLKSIVLYQAVLEIRSRRNDAKTQDVTRSAKRPLHQDKAKISIEADAAAIRSTLTHQDRIQRTNDLRRLLNKRRRIEDSPEEERELSPRDPISVSERPQPPPYTLIEQLLHSQSRRLELMLEEFREERREERQLAQDLLVMVLESAKSAPSSTEVGVLEALVRQQQGQLEYLFDVLEGEHEEDRYVSRAMLRYARR